MNRQVGKVFVWPLCTRIIHWIIATSFLASFSTAFFHDKFIYHVAFGYIFGIVLTFRIIWGFVGPQYATFNTFMLQFASLKYYFQEKIENRWRKIHPGHNPASSWFTLIVLSLGYLIVFSGIVLYGVQEGSGPVRFLNPHYYHFSNLFLLLHQYTSYILFLWAIIHIAGVLIEQFYHQTNMVFAMVTGYKKCDGIDTKISRIRNTFAYGAIVLVIYSFYFILSQPENCLTRNRFEPIDFEKENYAYYEKCG
ncbi:MAG: cytochrome b/b6 domain-containing protein, partial [Sulfurospirillaceae bacterium]|nr:cytochrome b/b6 domain-containing protein [Sulfurospirillaceae bacterium]